MAARAAMVGRAFDVDATGGSVAARPGWAAGGATVARTEPIAAHLSAAFPGTASAAVTLATLRNTARGRAVPALTGRRATADASRTDTEPLSRAVVVTATAMVR